MHLLFLCTGNSCRSQIAEAWARQLAPSSWHIHSAGIEAHGKNPRAIAVMQEAGIDIAKQESTVVTTEMLANTDYLVTVCGHAADNCPAVGAEIANEHWPLNDPAKATGSEDEIMAVFRTTRDDIRERVQALVNRLAKTPEA